MAILSTNARKLGRKAKSPPTPPQPEQTEKPKEKKWLSLKNEALWGQMYGGPIRDRLCMWTRMCS
jgi:hypothetical protein